MPEPYDESYLRVFNAAMSAAVDAASSLADHEIDRLARYSGIVGLAAGHVRASRSRSRERRAR